MQRWTLPVIVLFVAFIGLTAWLSYQVAVRFIQSNTLKFFNNAYSGDNYPPSPAEVDELLDEIAANNRDTDDPVLGFIYIDLLARRAWNHPETSRDDLRTAIKTSHEIYRDYDYRRPHLVRWMVYLYAAAGLPSKVERWHTEAIARDPASLEYVRYFQIASLVSRDDLAGARALLEEELGPDTPRPTAAGLAIAGYGLLGDQEMAAEYEPYVEEYGFIDDYFKHMYAIHLIEEGRFAEAHAILDELEAVPDDDPDDAQRLALIYAGWKGLDAVETGAMIDLSLLTTRRSLSREAFVAELLADLYRIEEDPTRLVRLFELSEAHPDDPQIAYQVALSAANCWEFHRNDTSTGADSAELTPLLTPEEAVLLSRLPADWARDAYDLATGDYEVINSGLLLATVLAWPDGQTELTDANLGEAVEVLRRILGDPAVANALDTQRLVDYELFLVDEQVIATRQAYPWFDTAVNHAIVDYLNRRREIFNDLVPLEPLAYRDQTSPEPVPARQADPELAGEPEAAEPPPVAAGT